MGLVDTEGLILKSYSLAEADKIIVLLTQNEGLIRGVAKGAKRLKSKFGGSLEPFTVVNISYYQKEDRELVSIRQIDLVKSHFENASEPLFLQKFSYLVDLLVEFAPPHDPNEKLYRMTKVCLETAAAKPDSLDSIAVYFELWILRLGGYLPNWNVCDMCRRELNPDEQSRLQTNFHLVCENCQNNRHGWMITAQQRLVFINAQKLSPLKFAGFADFLTFDVKEISTVLRRIISQIIGKESVGEKILSAGL